MKSFGNNKFGYQYKLELKMKYGYITNLNQLMYAKLV